MKESDEILFSTSEKLESVILELHYWLADTPKDEPFGLREAK